MSGSSTFSKTVRSPIRLKLWKMKPISRLRTRARSDAGSSATGRPFSRYDPSVGESSRPRIDSSVDLPQPDGPAIETYSPLPISTSMLDKRVRLDLVGEEHLRHAVQLDEGGAVRHLALMTSRGLLLASRTRSNASHADMSDRITLSPTFRPDRTSTVLTELRPSFTCTRVAPLPSGSHLEQADRALFLPERRPPDVQHVVQPLELDRAVDAQVGHGAFRQLAFSETSTVRVPFCTDGSMRMTRPSTMPLRVSIWARWPIWMSLAWVSAILISAFSRRWIGDAREVGAGRDLLPDFDRHQLQHAGEAGANLQFVALPLLQLQHRARLIDVGLLHGQPRPHRFGALASCCLAISLRIAELLGIQLRLPAAPAPRPAGPCASASFISACILALLYSASMLAAEARCCCS